MLIYITHRIIFSGFHWIKVITWYRADDGSQTISDLVSFVWFCFDGMKAKLRTSVPAQLLIGHGKQTKPFRRSPWQRNEKKLVDNSAQTNTKKSTIYAGAMYLRLPLLFYYCGWYQSLPDKYSYIDHAPK